MALTPYEAGKEAHAAGKRRRDNPHHMSSAAHDLWDEGWQDADDANEDPEAGPLG